MKLIFFVALLGCVLALQAPVEYEYKYIARIATGMQSALPEYAGTGIKADVRITMQEDGSGEVQLKNVEVGEGMAVLPNNGRDVLPIDYKPIEDKSIERPYKAYFRKQDGETVLEVPEDDVLWVTNIRRGVANFFRIAPIVQPGSVPPPREGSELLVGYSRIMDTFAGRCRVEYTITPAAISDVRSGIREDIQSRRAPKGPGGLQVKLEDDLHVVQSSIDFSTCSNRVFLSQTGAGNLTNVTSSSYRDVSARSHVGEYILKGKPGQFRMERGDVESAVILQPFGFNSAKVVIMSNQSVELVSAKPVPRNVRSSAQNLKSIKTWNHQLESPKPKPEGFAPRFIQYKNQNEPEYSPIFYQRLISGFRMNDDEIQDNLLDRVKITIEKAAERCRLQNKDSDVEPTTFRGTEDGRIAQGMMDTMHLLRALNHEKVQELDKKMQEHQDKLVREIFIDALAAAASGPTVKVLLRKIRNHELSDNRTASIFFNLANNIRSAEIIEELVDFAMSLEEEKNVTASLLVKNNVALIVRRICVSSQIKKYSHMMYAFGSKMCDRTKIVNKYLPHLEQKIESSKITWVKILNVMAAADLGARESIPILEKVARGDVSSDIFVRFAAIHGLSATNFDNSSRDKIFNVLQPIAESKVEDYRIRQVAYDSLLTFMPNVTFIQRMIFSSYDEPSQQVQSYISWVVDSLSRIEDPSYRLLSTAARNALALTRYMPASLNRPVDWIFSRYLHDDEIGSKGSEGWLSQYKSSFPREIYSFVAGKFGRFGIPILETVTFGNSQAMYGKLRSAAEEFSRKKGPSSAQEQERQHRLHDQFQSMHGGRRHSTAGSSDEREPDLYHFSRLWRTSEVFLPLTNELYQQTKGYLETALRNLGQGEEQKVLFFKYLNPVESNIIMPTAPGLFMKIELNTPTVLFGEVKMHAKISPLINNPSDLPKLQKINFRAEGIVKAISKTNSYSLVMAPWTNRTVLCGVDVEKTVSLPLKYEIEADLQTPAQILWAELTPQFNETGEDIPVIKIRTLPFTAIAGIMATLERHPTRSSRGADIGNGFQAMQRVQWLRGTENWFKEEWTFSKPNTGLSAKFDYRGEVQPPFSQSNVLRFLREPSRLMSLLASPTVKNYDLTIYQLKEPSQTKSIGAAIRFLQQSGTGEAISAESSKRPVDLSPEDTTQQREQKLQKFSNQENYELSAQLNFTGSVQPKVYEVVITSALHKEVGPNPDFETVARKIQVSVLENNQDSKRPKKTCGVVAQMKPQLVSMPLPRAVSPDQNIRSDVNFDVFQGDSCAAGQPTIVEGKTVMKVSEERLVALRNITGGIPLSRGNSSEFYKLAVYDELNMDVKWEEPSSTFKNISLKSQDLIEGYLFPKIVKNRLAKNQDKKMVVRARRFVGDNRANARVQLPHQTVDAQTVDVSTLFDFLVSFAPRELQNSRRSRSGARIVQAPSGSGCLLKPDHVQTFDGVSYRKLTTGCTTAAVKVSQGQDKIAVLTSQPAKSATGPQEVKVISTKSGLEIDVTGQNVQVNGQSMSEQSKVVKDSSGNTVAKISRTQDLVAISITNKVEIVIKQGNLMMIKLDQRFKTIAEGLCGDFNSDSKNDLRGPKGCIYKPEDGTKYAASWVTDETTCQEPEMKTLFEDIKEYQKNCPTGHRRPVSGPTPCSNPSHVYPVGHKDETICVGKYTVIHCQSGCHSANTHETSIPSKCWNSGTAPQEVRESVSRGYMTSIPNEKADFERPFLQKSPTGCTQGRQSSLESGPCSQVMSVYPVTKSHEDLCVGEHTVSRCPEPCRPETASIVKMRSRCWSSSTAPESVKESESRGYMERLPNEHPETTKEMSYRSELNCVSKRRQSEQELQGQQQHQRHHHSLEGHQNHEQQQQHHQRHHQSVEGQQNWEQQQQQQRRQQEQEQSQQQQERRQQEQQQDRRSHPRQVSAGSDPDCFINEAYPVRAVSSELCVTERASKVCKPECRAADTVPTSFRSKCWQKNRAPEEVKAAERRGYTTSPVSEHDEREREITVQVPHSCFKRQN